MPEDVKSKENEDVTILLDKVIETDMQISNSRTDIAVFDRKGRKWALMNIAVPMDHRVVLKEQEKRETYSDLTAELRGIHRTETEIIPIITGAMETIPKGLAYFIINASMIERIEEQEQRIGKLEEKHEILERKVAFLEISLVLQNRHVDDLEQYRRRLCLRFYGFPVVEKETASDVLSKVIDVETKLGLEIPDSGIDRAHRIGRIHE